MADQVRLGRSLGATPERAREGKSAIVWIGELVERSFCGGRKKLRAGKLS